MGRIRKLLLVEPNTQMRAMIKHSLRSRGIESESILEASTFSSGSKILSEAKGNRIAPDLILCDCGWNGESFLSGDLIREAQDLEGELKKQIHVVLLMSLPTQENVRKAMSFGVNNILIRPFTTEMLNKVIDEVIQSKILAN